MKSQNGVTGLLLCVLFGIMLAASPDDVQAGSRLPGTTVTETVRTSASCADAKWKRVRSADGYEIQISYSADFPGKNTKTVRAGSNRKIKANLKSLKKDREYYVRVRAYVVSDGDRYYSSWCKAKKISSVIALIYPVRIDKKHFPDRNVRGAVKLLDLNGDGRISYKESRRILELPSVSTINAGGIQYFSKVFAEKGRISVPDSFRGTLYVNPQRCVLKGSWKWNVRYIVSPGK